MKVPKWDGNEVLEKLEDVDFLFDAIEAVYDENQSQMERDIGRSKGNDRLGFNYADSVFFSEFVAVIKAVKDGDNDYDKIVYLERRVKRARIRFRKYRWQVARLLNDDLLWRDSDERPVRG
jgi:hypothetical protein